MSTIDLSFSGTGALLLFVAKTTLLLVAALLAAASLRRSTAGARHLVWLATLVGVLALPLLSRISSLKVGVLPSALGGPTPVAVAPEAERESPTSAVVVSSSAPVLSSVSVASRPVGDATPVVASASNGVGFFPALAVSGYSLLSTIAIVWAFVALALVGWLVAGAVYVRRIVDGSTELTSPDWTMPLCEVADRLDLDVPPRVVMSDRIEMAFACRALAPTIVLPAAADEWTDDRRRAVLFHELAHIKRHDLLGHTLGRLACALYWFHPLVWTAAKRLRAESERACDDLVLSCGARPSEYAQHLLDMVTNVRDQGAPIMALPMARKKEFEGRMLAILDPAIRRASPGRLQAAAVVATLGVLSLTVAAVSPAAATQARIVDASTSPVAEASIASETQTPLPPPAVAPSPSPSVSPAPSASPRPQGDARSDSAVIGPKEVSVSVDVGSLMNSVANGLIKGVGAAFKTSGARISFASPVQATDTGRIALMIKVLKTDTDASVRRTAAWALQEVKSTDARAALTGALHSDADARVREMAAWALGEQDAASAATALSDALLHDKSPHVRATSAWALGEIEAKTEISAIESGMADPEPEVREMSIWALGQFNVRTAPKLLTGSLTDGSKQVRLVTAWALGEIEDKSTAPAILAAFKTETDAQVRSAELRALAIMGEATAEVVETALKSSDPEVRRRAVAMLAGSRSVEPWPWPWPQPRPSP